MNRSEAHARYQYALSHPQPIAVEGRLIQGMGWGLLLAVPSWAIILGLALWARRALGAP